MLFWITEIEQIIQFMTFYDQTFTPLCPYMSFYVLYREQVYSRRNNNSSLSSNENMNVKLSCSNLSVSSCLDNIEGMKSKNIEVWK